MKIRYRMLVIVPIGLLLLLVSAIILYFSAMANLTEAKTLLVEAVELEGKAQQNEKDMDVCIAKDDELKVKAANVEEKEFERIRDKALQNIKKYEQLLAEAKDNYDKAKSKRQQSKVKIKTARWKFKILLMPLPDGHDQTE